MRALEEYEKLIGYEFRDRGLLETALTHSSYANEHKTESYERLEFLGDSVLGFVTAEYLFENMGHLSEGQLTKTRAALVCEKSLCGFARRLAGAGSGPVYWRTCSSPPPPPYTLTAVSLMRQRGSSCAS